MKTLKQLCTPRQSIFDAAKRDTVLSLNNLVRDQLSPAEFFEENHLTQGMRLLLENGFKRLEGKSDQGVFRLTQAMGGGKTHNLITFGLLAQHPEYRKPVMGAFYTPGPLGKVRVVAFTGRESDAPLGIWGSIAEQLGKKEVFRDYYSPLSAPGQKAWVNLLQGEPLIIMLDELPPYFEYAKSRAIGNSDLSVVTSTALSNLFVAVTEDLPQVCVVITDLTASYAEGSQHIIQALGHLEQEANRVALDLEPVRMNTDEFYHILRKRLFSKLPLEAEIAEVAQGYAKAVRDAKQMDITHASPEQFAAQVMEAYPFHPGLRDLYARFKENQGFQQTRGLIRLMRVIAARLWEQQDHAPYLIAAHNLDLNHRETLSEITRINPTLETAIARDIASGGGAFAERMDANLGGRDTQDVACLLLVASLAHIPGATRGLAIPEVIAHLCEPGREVSRLKNEVLNTFLTTAHYLHSTADSKLYFKNTENLIAKLNTTAKGYLREQSIKELQSYLLRLFTPSEKYCYQDILALPAVDDIKPQQDRGTLVICYPHPEGLHPDLKTFYEQLTFQNRILFLTGQRNFNSLLESAKRYKAIQAIVGEMEQERAPANDPQLVQARELLDKIQGQLLMSVKETFNTLYYPTRNGLDNAEFLMRFTGNAYQGEVQIIEALTEAQKYTADVTSETFLKKVEARLFTQKTMPWTDIKKRSATVTGWQWHRPDALELLKADCLRKGSWREAGGYLEKGPFPKPETSLTIQELSRDNDTGKVKLKLNPVHADTFYAEIGAPATTASQRLEERIFETNELEVSFLAVDSTGEHQTGKTVTWKNRITLKSRPYRNGSPMMVELQAAPKAPIRYTTDGSNPKNGSSGLYEGPFPVSEGARLVLAYAEYKGVTSEVHELTIPWDASQSFQVDKAKPAIWKKRHELTSTPTSYGFLARVKKHQGRIAGTRVTLTQDDTHWVEVQVSEQVAVEPEQVEAVVNTLRALLTEDANVAIEVERLDFAHGQGLLDYVGEVKADLYADEVLQ